MAALPNRHRLPAITPRVRRSPDELSNSDDDTHKRQTTRCDADRRLLNDLARFTSYLGQSAGEETLRTALAAALVKVVGSNDNGRPLVMLTSKGARHQSTQGQTI